MTTSRKSESARANGAKSRGPTTPEGKLASSQNATQHGIFSRTMVLQCESQPRCEQVLAELKDQVQPRNSSESGYVETMAIARWRQRRFSEIQKAAIKLQMARIESANDVPCETPEKLRRYETSCKRQLIRAKAAIQKMRRQEPLDAKDSASLPSSPLSSAPRLAALLTTPTFMDPPARAKKIILQNEPTTQEKVILQNEPMTQNETTC